MALVTFKFDTKIEKMVEKLKQHYGATSKAEVFRKAPALLNVAAEVEDDHGKIIAKKGELEREIIVR